MNAELVFGPLDGETMEIPGPPLERVRCVNVATGDEESYLYYYTVDNLSVYVWERMDLTLMEMFIE